MKKYTRIKRTGNRLSNLRKSIGNRLLRLLLQ